jgi:hypothetical protein
LLQVRTKTLNNELMEVFQRWHPGFREAEEEALLLETDMFNKIETLSAGQALELLRVLHIPEQARK